MLDYDVSMHNIVVLVVVIPTSPSSSKTESDCKSYCVFGVGHFIDRPGQPLGRPGWENGRGSSVGGRPSWPGYWLGYAMPWPAIWPAIWPAWPASCYLPSTGRILPFLFKGFLPQMNHTFCPTLELIFLHCCHPFELCYLQSLQ